MSASVSIYSHLSNKRGAWNKRGGWNIVMKSINVEGGLFFCGGWNFSKSLSMGSTFIREMKVFIYNFKLPLDHKLNDAIPILTREANKYQRKCF